MKVKDLISKLNSYDPDLELEDLSDLNGHPREEWCFPLLDAEELLRHLDKMIEVKSKYHPAFLDLSYEEFSSRYAIPSDDGGSYTYCVRKEDDSDDNRRSYIDYLKGERLI